MGSPVIRVGTDSQLVVTPRRSFFMKKLMAAAVAASLIAAVPSLAADPPYKIPPGQYCQGVSKTHIAGQKGTPFSQCVKAMAQINKKPDTAPSQACAGLKKA